MITVVWRRCDSNKGIDLMAERAKISRHYNIRLLVIGLGALVMGLWFLRDGMITYPEQQRVHQQFTEVKTQHPEDYNQRWIALADENGWPHDPVEKTDMDILTQLIIAGILIPIGVVVRREACR